jgi:enoyl-CoA hydratase/carnithine racemase
MAPWCSRRTGGWRRPVPERSVTVAHRGPVTVISLTRPDRNLLTLAMMNELREALIAADGAREVGAVVLGSSVDGVFCGGADIAGLRAGDDPAAFARGAADLFRQFARSGVPIVAAVGGDALASGFGLVCLADLAIGVPEAHLGTNEAALGSWPMLAEVALLHRLPLKIAMRTVLTGQPFTAHEALQWGVLNEIVGARELSSAALRLAELAMCGGAWVRSGRPLFYRLAGMSFDQGLDEAATAFAAMFIDQEVGS